jgi:hypothetical protein
MITEASARIGEYLEDFKPYSIAYGAGLKVSGIDSQRISSSLGVAA